MSVNGWHELELATTAVVADALDRLELRTQVLDPAVRPVAPGTHLVGRVLPVVVEAGSVPVSPPYDDWMRLIEAIEPGEVVTVEVDPGTLAATWGELFSCAARGRGARGAITDGYIRDSRQIIELGFPLFARGCSPLDTVGRARITSVGSEARCGGVLVCRGDYLFADGDGAVVVPAAALDDVLAIVRDKSGKESGGREDLLAGATVREVWDRYGVF